VRKIKGKNDRASALLDRNNAAGNDKDALFLRHDGQAYGRKPKFRQAGHLIHAALTPKLGRA
jgi:hypothetical protein